MNETRAVIGVADAATGEPAERVEHRSFCRICIALCGVVVTTEGDQVVQVRGDTDHPLSRGYTCPKGRSLGAAHHDPDRLDLPLMRRDGELVPVSWDECLDDIAARMAALLAERGADAIGMYLATASAFDANGRRISEKLLKALGSRSRYTSTTVDTPCKPLVSHLMAGHPGLVPSMDQNGADLVVLIGMNPVVSHGHLNSFPDPVVRLREIARRGELWVIDPRRTETSRLATRHLQPRPGTDYVLLAHLIRELLRDGADHAYLADHANGVDRLAEAVEPFVRQRAAELTGVAASDLDDLVDAVRRRGRIAAQTGTGTTMSAAANVTEWLTWAVHVVTGSWERPRGMWFNPGFLKQLDQRSLSATEAVAAPGPPSRPDLTSRLGEYPCAALADEIETGNLRALFVLGGNPVTSLPETERLTAALATLDLLVVSDVVHTSSTSLATHVLPCLGQLERPDLPHNVDQFQLSVASQYTDAVVPPTGERKPMWWPYATLARRLGHDLLDGCHPDEVTDEELLAKLADRSRTSFAELRDAPTGVVAEEAAMGWVERDLLPDGRWQVAPQVLVDQLRLLPDPAALVLIPRRQLRHLNSQLHAVSARAGRADHAEALVHPDDAAAAGVADGDEITIVSATGELVAVARVNADIRPGAVSIPHGYTDANVSRLTSGSIDVDPLTGMVRQSGIPITIRRKDAGTRFVDGLTPGRSLS